MFKVRCPVATLVMPLVQKLIGGTILCPCQNVKNCKLNFKVLAQLVPEKGVSKFKLALWCPWKHPFVRNLQGGLCPYKNELNSKVLVLAPGSRDSNGIPLPKNCITLYQTCFGQPSRTPEIIGPHKTE